MFNSAANISLPINTSPDVVYKPNLLEQVKENLRIKYYSPKTEEAYINRVSNLKMSWRKESVRLTCKKNIDMHDLFLNIMFNEEKQNNWNVDMQLHAYLCSLINNSVRLIYKLGF